MSLLINIFPKLSLPHFPPYLGDDADRMCLGAIWRGCGFGRVENDDATDILLHHTRQRLLERISTVDSDDLAGWYHELFDEHLY